MKWSERALLREPKHGTQHEYNKYKCRCDLCVKANVDHAAYYRKNKPEAHRAAVKKCATKTVEMLREAKAKPCADCGIQYPHYVMQFDHLHSKEFQLSDKKTRYRGRERVLAEIEKCDVVCANCHHARTYNRRAESLTS